MKVVVIKIMRPRLIVDGFGLGGREGMKVELGSGQSFLWQLELD
jgi:hypothetical protein